MTRAWDFSLVSELILPTRTAIIWSRLAYCWRRIAVLRVENMHPSKSHGPTAQSCRIRPPWLCIVDVSIFWRIICAGIPTCFSEGFRMKRFTRPNWDATPIALTPCTVLPWTERHYCTCASTSNEIEIARWLIDHGADVNAKAAVDGDGFGGHTRLFGCVVSQAYLCRRQQDGEFPACCSSAAVIPMPGHLFGS